MEGLKEISPRVYHAPQWKDARLKPGTVVALRTYYRPAPGIFLSNDKDTRLQNVKVHYAEGMGLLAQLCEISRWMNSAFVFVAIRIRVTLPRRRMLPISPVAGGRLILATGCMKE